MIWREQAKKLIDVLGLEGSPVGVSYRQEPLPGADTAGKFWVCEAIKNARDGSVIQISKDNSACFAGTWYLGLCPRPEGEQYRLLKKFVVEGEKLCATYASFHRMLSLITPPPVGIADWIALAPLDGAETPPDAAVFFVNAEQGSRLLTLATYHSGLAPRVEMHGPTCHQVIAYPVASGQLNVSLMDITSRKRYRPDELCVSIPGYMLETVVDAIDRCTAGTAPFEVPLEWENLAESLLTSQKKAKKPKKKKKDRSKK